jgi:DNA-binding GntR family transcriptional regulator
LSPRTPWGTYQQIADVLRSRIAAGTPAPGEALPSEAALGQEFNVSRTTVRRALAELEAERLIKPLPGTGRVVCTPQERDATEKGGPPPAQYRRIAAALREQITSGELAPGAALPSEAALVRQYGVSRGTARQALSELEGTGLVVAVHGKGRFVTGGETSAR